MSRYIVGDIHAYFQPLQQLLEEIGFDESEDELFLLGDLINRGPDSLEALQWAVDMSESMGDRFDMVLGNHDLYALARYADIVPKKKRDSLDELLADDDADDLFAWLRHRPLAISFEDALLVHAGVDPSWHTAEIVSLARDIESCLQSPSWEEFLFSGLRSAPRNLADVEGEDQLLHYALYLLTHVRCFEEDGEISSQVGSPDDTEEGVQPWFSHSERRSSKDLILFGHWAALGLLQTDNAICLDTGCGWGEKLSAYRLDDGKLFQVKNKSSE